MSVFDIEVSLPTVVRGTQAKLFFEWNGSSFQAAVSNNILLQVAWFAMEGFTFFLRLGGKVVGRFSAHLDTSNTLACAKGRRAARNCLTYGLGLSFLYGHILLGHVGSLTEAAERALGHKVVIKRFMVTVWGRTGYLRPEQEHAPLEGKFEIQLSSKESAMTPLQILIVRVACRLHISYDLSYSSIGLGCSHGTNVRTHAVQVTVTNEALL